MHYIYKNGYINDNQYGFTPQKSTTDAAMAVKEFLEPEMVKGKVAVMVSLDVQWAFNAAWWPATLKGLRDAKCPRNLYQLHRIILGNEEQLYYLTVAFWKRQLLKAAHKGHAADPDIRTYNITPSLH